MKMKKKLSLFFLTLALTIFFSQATSAVCEFTETESNESFSGANTFNVSGCTEITINGERNNEIDIFKLENINLGPNDTLQLRWNENPSPIWTTAQLFETEKNIIWMFNAGNSNNPNSGGYHEFVSRKSYNDLYFIVFEKRANYTNPVSPFNYQVILSRGTDNSEQQVGQNVLLDFDGGTPSQFVTDSYNNYYPPYSSDLWQEEFSYWDPVPSREEQIETILQVLKNRFEGNNITFYVEDSLSGTSDLPPSTENYARVFITESSSENFGISTRIDNKDNDSKEGEAIIYQGSHARVLGDSGSRPSFNTMMSEIADTIAHEIGHLIGLEHTGAGDLMDGLPTVFNMLNDDSFNRTRLTWEAVWNPNEAYQDSPLLLDKYSLGNKFCADLDDVHYPPGQTQPNSPSALLGGLLGNVFSSVNGIKTDSCDADKQYIWEAYCGEDASGKTQKMACNNSLAGSVCVGSVLFPWFGSYCQKQSSCLDTDSLPNPVPPTSSSSSLARQGVIEYWQRSTGSTQFYYDECIGGGAQVKEYYCTDALSEPESVTLFCPGDQICTNGKCENPPNTCIDECSARSVVAGCRGNYQPWDCASANDGDSCADRIYSSCGSGQVCREIGNSRGKIVACVAANWDATQATAGETVSLNLGVCTEDECIGQVVNFEVFDAFDNPVSTNPALAIIQADGSATTSWIAQRTGYSEQINPEFYFNATLVDDPSIVVSSEQPLTVISRCGNGTIDEDEQCDDGNIVSGDGCSAACLIEEICKGSNAKDAALVFVHKDSGDLFLVSSVDGTETPIGTTITGLGSLEMGPDGKLYGFTTGVSYLYEISLVDGSVTSIGRIFTNRSIFEGGLAIAQDGTAYGVNEGTLNNPQLFTVDLLTGAGSLVGRIESTSFPGAEHDIEGLVFRDDGMLIALDRISVGDGRLYLIDPANGEIGSMLSNMFVPADNTYVAVGIVGGMTIFNGEAYFITATPVKGGDDALYKINIDDGTGLTRIKTYTHSDPGIGGLATISCPASVCGNGVIQYGEECDDGNTLYNDGCSGICLIEFCGDNVCNNSETCSTCSNDCGSCPPSGGGGGGSFLPGTKIIMGDHSTKNIEDIKVGDQVLSYDTKTESIVTAKVSGTLSHTMPEYYVINNDLEITATNPILANGEWKLPPQLKIGDKLLLSEGKTGYINSIQYIKKQVIVHNLQVENTHTYFAGGISVHNQNIKAYLVKQKVTTNVTPE